MVGRCDNCGRRRRLHRWDFYYVCSDCFERIAGSRAKVDRLFNRMRRGAA